jgi:hypothetical protein
MKTAENAAVLKLHGEPHRLALTSPALADHKTVAVDLPESLKQSLGSGEVKAEIRSWLGERGHLRLRLPRATPPGRYNASIRTDKTTVPVEIEVAPYRRLKAAPAGVTFAGKPGQDVSVSITFKNAGNSNIDIPERSHVGIYDDDGIETAFASAYRDEVQDPMEMIKAFVRKLREGHGGLLKLRIQGAGMLEPGHHRTMTVTGHLPESVKPGHAYHGVWTIEGLNYAVFVEVSKEKGAI